MTFDAAEFAEAQRSYGEAVQYLLTSGEEASLRRGGRKRHGRPVLMFPNGKVRVEYFGTFPNVFEAVEAVRTVVGG